MLKFIKERASEPTSYLALGAILSGIGQLVKDDNLPVIADTLAQAADPLAQGDYTAGGALIVSGLFGLFMKEKAQ